MSRLVPAPLRCPFAAAVVTARLATPALAADPWVLPESGSGQGTVTETPTPSILAVHLARSDHSLGTMAYTESGSFSLTPPAPVPEPGPWALALAGGGVLVARGARRGERP